MEEYVYLLIIEYPYDGLDDTFIFKNLEDTISFVQYNYSNCDYTIGSIDNIELVNDFYSETFMCNETNEEMCISIIKKKILQ